MSWDGLPAGTKDFYDKEMANAFDFFTGQDFDHLPVNPVIMGHAGVFHGRSLYDYYSNPEQAVAWQMDIARFYGLMPNPNYLYATYWNEDYGGTIKMPTGRMSAPGILTYPADTVDKADKLTALTPEELAKGPTMKLHARGLKATEKFVGEKYTPMQFIYEPFVIGSFWVSPENMLMWCHQEPDLVHHVMREVVTHSINACQLVSDMYDGKPFMTQCATLLANSSTMSVDQCKEFATDYLKEALNKIVKIGSGSTGVFYHQCGDHAQDYALCEDMPFPTGSVMHVAYDGLKPFDLLKAAKVYENKVAMLGNFDTAIAFRGTPKQIYDLAYEQASKYKHFKKGFIPGMACECPPFISAANLQAFVQGSRDGGKLK